MEAQTPTARRNWLVEFYGSTVGKKWVMALTGVILMGFVVFHMIGNLKVFVPPLEGGELEINLYGEWLRQVLFPALPEYVFLWILRLGLIVATVLHVEAMISLTRRNAAAKPQGYTKQEYQAASYASRTMRLTGPIVLAFVIFHLADLTWGIAPFNPDFIHGDVAHNLTASLSRAGWVAFYAIANLALGYHLWHGLWSMFQSLGLNNPRYNAARRTFAQAVTVLVVGGNLLILAAVFFGFAPGI